MSTAFSQKMQRVGTKLLTKYGSTVTLVRAGVKTWDSVNAEFVFGPETRISVNAAPVPVNASLVDGTTIQAGDMVVKMDYNGGIAPTVNDKFDFGQDTWAVVAVETRQVNDDVVAYFVQVRK